MIIRRHRETGAHLTAQPGRGLAGFRGHGGPGPAGGAAPGDVAGHRVGAQARGDLGRALAGAKNTVPSPSTPTGDLDPSGPPDAPASGGPASGGPASGCLASGTPAESGAIVSAVMALPWWAS